MAAFAFWRVTPWKPTDAQEGAALRLAEVDGGFVRTYADGTAELRMTHRGGLQRYVIADDGEATLVESRRRTSRYAHGARLSKAGAVVLFGGLVTAVVVPWADLIVYFGLASLIIGLAIGATGAYRAWPPGDRWTKIGGPDF